MHARRPKAASVKAGIPTLGALLAAGAQLAGCIEPMCAGNRVAELDTHGRAASQRAQQGHPGTALRELAVATGLVAHPTTVSTVTTPTVVPPIVVPVPPELDPQLVPPQGGMPPATLEPVTPPPPVVQHPAVPHTAPPGRREGGIRSHTSTPPPPPRDPLHQPSWEGDSVYVGPLPPDDAPLAPMHHEPHPLGLRPA